MKISSIQASGYGKTSFKGNLILRNLSTKNTQYFYTNLYTDRKLAESFTKLHNEPKFLNPSKPPVTTVKKASTINAYLKLLRDEVNEALGILPKVSKNDDALREIFSMERTASDGEFTSFLRYKDYEISHWAQL